MKVAFWNSPVPGVCVCDLIYRQYCIPETLSYAYKVTCILSDI